MLEIVVKTVTKTVTKNQQFFQPINSKQMNINATNSVNGDGGIRLPYAVQYFGLKLVIGYLVRR
jgi:hypothetical protein